MKCNQMIYEHLCDTAVRRKKKPHKVYTIQTASYSSTLAEEFVVLLRKLHTLPVWNGLINQHISVNLHAIASFILEKPPSDQPSSSPGDGSGLKVSTIMILMRLSERFSSLLRSLGRKSVTSWDQCLQCWL